MKNISDQLILFLCLLLPVLSGCDAVYGFKRPEIISVLPSHNSVNVSAYVNVIVDFSKSMDTAKCNNEFSLNGESGRIDGVYNWENDNKRLIFNPFENLSIQDKYTIRIKTGAEDAEGNDLDREFVSVFFVNGETVSPFVTAFTPMADSIGNLSDSAVVITFSEPVDLKTIYSGISISPSIQGIFSWNSGVYDSTVITFTPVYGFNYGTTYRVEVTSSILDLSGNILRDPLTFNFTAGDDFVKPVLTAYQKLNLESEINFSEEMITHGAEKDKPVVLSFSKIISSDNLRSAISISPSAGFYLSSENTDGKSSVRINFTDNLMSEEIYTIRINSSVTDLYGNPLAEDYSYVFVTDGVNSRSPIVGSIGDSVSGALWNLNEIQILPLPAGAVHPTLFSDIVVVFKTNEDLSTEIDPLSLSIYAENSAGTGGSPSIVSIDWPGGNYVKFSRLKFGLYNVRSGNIYKIVIKGGKSGLRDMNNNFMKNDFVQMVRF